MLESLFNKVACPEGCNFIKKRLENRHFPVKFAKILRTPILKIILKYATTHNHPQPLTTIQKTTQNHPQPPKIYPKKAKTCYKQLCYCNLDVNTETLGLIVIDVYIDMCVCVCVCACVRACVYIFYKSLYLLFFC